MISSASRSAHRIVIAGGGIGALEALVALSRQAPAGCRITLASPATTFGYRPLAVQEPFGRGGGRRYSLQAIARDLGAAYVRDALSRVDGPGRTAVMQSGTEIRYDTLLVAIGARPYPAFAHGVTFDRETEAAAFDELLADVDARLAPHVAIVVPEHVGWTLPAYELALSISAYGHGPYGRPVAVTIVTHEPQPLAAFGTSASRRVAEVLDEAGVTVVAGREAVVMSDGALIAGSQWITADRIVTLPRLAGPRPRGVPCDPHGFIPVDDHGRVTGLPHVYAAGDGNGAAIKQGGLAAQQADAAVAHMLWRLGAGPEEPQPPAQVLRGVLGTSHGTLYLQADLGPGRAGEGSVASLRPLWPAPGRVASRWLGPYLEGAEQAGGAAERARQSVLTTDASAPRAYLRSA
jgi:sulfide:quinone oxidoreductase